ncbi:hypothetical protein TH53_14290 [Pedobacter lusitanus]|uniref:Uncharacterized protein n=1 Tax=Pedobacter lusitanus TaxID=1503925 RepID=A0A0D0GGU3_9SPHI|nr:hypothetical protein [Pedobacter lusitanus]KIO76527.1 hypothetical protein TH53_14290 [Pedobacter lusitanus]
MAKLSGVSKILIYRYFGDFNQMVRCYVIENNFWTNNLAEPSVSEGSTPSMQELIKDLLNERFTSFYNHCEMEAMVLNNTSDYNPVIKKKSGKSRLQNRKMQAIKEPGYNNCISYFDVVSTLLVAGTNHLVLGGYSEKKIELLNSIEKIIEWTFGDNVKDKDYN